MGQFECRLELNTKWILKISVKFLRCANGIMVIIPATDFQMAQKRHIYGGDKDSLPLFENMYSLFHSSNFPIVWTSSKEKAGGEKIKNINQHTVYI